jgi:hypothetical protein
MRKYFIALFFLFAAIQTNSLFAGDPKAFVFTLNGSTSDYNFFFQGRDSERTTIERKIREIFHRLYPNAKNMGKRINFSFLRYGEHTLIIGIQYDGIPAAFYYSVKEIKESHSTRLEHARTHDGDPERYSTKRVDIRIYGNKESLRDEFIRLAGMRTGIIHELFFDKVLTRGGWPETAEQLRMSLEDRTTEAGEALSDSQKANLVRFAAEKTPNEVERTPMLALYRGCTSSDVHELEGNYSSKASGGRASLPPERPSAMNLPAFRPQRQRR